MAHAYVSIVEISVINTNKVGIPDRIGSSGFCHCIVHPLLSLGWRCGQVDIGRSFVASGGLSLVDE